MGFVEATGLQLQSDHVEAMVVGEVAEDRIPERILATKSIHKLVANPKSTMVRPYPKIPIIMIGSRRINGFNEKRLIRLLLQRQDG